MRNGNASFKLDSVPMVQDRKSGEKYISVAAVLLALYEYRNDFITLKQPQHVATVDPIISILRDHL